MDDMEKKLKELLNNPDQLQELKALADSVFAEEPKAEELKENLFKKPEEAVTEKNTDAVKNNILDILSQIPNGNNGKNRSFANLKDSEFLPNAELILKTGKILKNQNPDNRISLLLALKPHLSPEKRKKVDSAVKILKIYNIIPVLKESGILDSFLD